MLPGLRTWDPPLSPPSTLAEIFWHACLQSHIQTSPPTPQVNFWNFHTKNFYITSKTLPRGARGVFKFFGGLISPFFVRINPLWSFRTLTDLLLKFPKKSLKKPKNRPPGGQGVGVRILSFSQNFYYFFLGAHAKMWNPTTTPSVVLNNGGNNNNKKKKD